MSLICSYEKIIANSEMAMPLESLQVLCHIASNLLQQEKNQDEHKAKTIQIRVRQYISRNGTIWLKISTALPVFGIEFFHTFRTYSVT